jgi:hypothetical protein
VLQREMDNALGCNSSAAEAIDNNAVARIGVTVSEGVGKRGQACVQVFPVAAERQSGIERLLGPRRCASIRKIFDCAGLGIQHCQRLLIFRLERPIPSVDGHHISTVGG